MPVSREYTDSWTPISLAIQKGRDHGISVYHEALNLCEEQLRLQDNMTLTFEDLASVSSLDEVTIDTLKKIYMNASDIDLIVGALLEKPAMGTVFGPTLSCLFSIQFAKLRNSDRFWYENDIPPSSLTLKQLQAIRRSSLAGILCAAGGVRSSQPKAFIRQDSYL